MKGKKIENSWCWGGVEGSCDLPSFLLQWLFKELSLTDNMFLAIITAYRVGLRDVIAVLLDTRVNVLLSIL